MIFVDIGNTNISIAWVREEKFVKVLNMDSCRANKKNIEKVFSEYSGEKILICSVVPRLTAIFRSLKIKVYVAGEDIKVPIRCFYAKKQVGMDRLVGAFAAREIFPSVRLIIDFGTAITFDFLSPRGDYEGGLILPGIGSSLKVLSSCALLPEKVELKKVKGLIPKDTQESISKGIKEGFSVMINSLVEKYKKILKISSLPIITGGDASFIIPHLNFSYHNEPFLVLKGLVILAKRVPL